MVKKYILTIEFNTKTEEVEYIQEEIIDDGKVVECYRVLTLEDYFDKDSMELIDECYIIGES